MMPSLDLARVVVIGTSCAGKTTLARRLAGMLGSEHVELDSVYWGPEWTPRPDFIQTVLAIAQRPRWVIDGNYSAVQPIIWSRSSAIVWLDYSFARVFSQALRRTALARMCSPPPLAASVGVSPPGVGKAERRQRLATRTSAFELPPARRHHGPEVI
jgi:hypothetical protein